MILWVPGVSFLGVLILMHFLSCLMNISSQRLMSNQLIICCMSVRIFLAVQNNGSVRCQYWFSAFADFVDMSVNSYATNLIVTLSL